MRTPEQTLQRNSEDLLDQDGERTSKRRSELTSAPVRARIAIAVLAGTACWAAAGRARAHEPFEITADARTGPAETTLRLLIAGHTAQLLCGPLPQGTDAGSWQRCGAALFTVTGADGRRLPVQHVDASVTVEGDVSVALQYAAPAPGRLRFDATFLQRLADPTYGATLTITGPGVFLGQRLLRASAPSVVVVVPSPPARTVAAGTSDRMASLPVAASLVEVAVAAAFSIGLWSVLASRARRRTIG